jgi:outer membrane lipoprotein-sorting protein
MNNDFIALAASAIAVVSLSLSLHLWSESKACSTSLKEHLQTIETMERTLLMTK